MISYLRDIILLFNSLGGYRVVETPCSISNQEAKHHIADDTCPYGAGKVGRRPLSFFFLLFIPLPFLKKSILCSIVTPP